VKNQIFPFSVGNTEAGLETKRYLLGNKGANLADMCSLGIPIPPGFILSTEFCKEYIKNDSKLSSEMILEVQNHIKRLENTLFKKFGTGDNPLLVSVRSGAVISMPGMMDTVLNIGLNDDIVDRLAKYSGNPVFAYDSYRRLIQMYSSVVLEIDNERFDHILSQYDKKSMQSLQDLQEIIEKFKNIVVEVTDEQFPQNVEKQLISSIEAVFKSWNSERARIYRDKNLIDHSLSTAATIQTMVFGNVDENSCTGVLFTRNPISGDKNVFGEFLPRAQGEDVVSGYVDTFPLTKLDAERTGVSADLSMEFSRPEIFKKLVEIAMKLEMHYQEMQDIEFTVQEGSLWILQTRSGKRSPAAAAKIAIDMVAEGLKSEEQALHSIDINCIEQSIHKQLIVTKDLKVIAKGLAASPGAAAGVVALTPQRAEVLAKNYPVILIRSETNPEDISGMYAAEGILTGRGGVTSHAAVVARGIGKPCICSVENFHIIDASSVSINGTTFHEGDYITINGSTGEVFAGNIPMTASGISTELLQIMSWAKKHKKISVLANAETPEDVRNALLFEAEGIGLCRTEHMFFADDRINDVRSMILAKNLEEREVLLKKISQYQKDDFKKLFKILDGKTICIRLLDPPLHEFLPQTEADLKNFCDATKNDLEMVKSAVQSLHEHNPMLGHRGVRLGISYPEIYKSQVEAIFQAMVEHKNEVGEEANVEIMIPLIFSENELIFMKNTIEHIGDTIFRTNNLQYKFGAMIELPRIALTADKLCDYVDFVSFGTNDLTQTTLGISRDDSSKFINEYRRLGILSYDPFVTIDRDGVGELIKIAVNKIKSKNSMIKIGICGEHGGNVESIDFFHSIGIDYVSCSPYRIPVARLTASRL
jgi:pyruvate,orthophosphate dikinase